MAHLDVFAWVGGFSSAPNTKPPAELVPDPVAAQGRAGCACLLEIVEGFLEPGDSVKRRKTANRIYRDVVAERVSSKRAEVELKSLTQRQKGGWLARAVEGLRRKLGNGAAPSEPPRLAETRKEPVRT